VGIDEQELAQARANRRELAWVKARLADVAAERERVAHQLAVYEKARDYEQADVDKLTQGVGRFFRMVVDQTQLTKEQQELAAAQLLCDEMEDELHALDVELAHLDERRRAVAGAEEHYTELLRDIEAIARGRGEWNEELNALAASEAELEASRHELGEIIAAAIEVQQIMREIVHLARELHPHHLPGSNLDDDFWLHLFDAIRGHTSQLATDLCRAVACAQQGLRALEKAWAQVTSTSPLGGPMQLNVELPTIGKFVARDVLWTNHTTLQALLDEVSRTSSTLAWRVGELRERDASYARALAECARMRARLLDPSGGEPYR
jgi:hypothetical protein